MSLLKKSSHDNKDKGDHNENWFITVERGEGVEDKDRWSKSDTYVIIELADQNVRTHTINNTRTPFWNETFNLKVRADHIKNLCVRLMDDDFGKDDPIGTAIISREDLPLQLGDERYLRVPLFRKEQSTGIVILRIKRFSDDVYNTTSLTTAEQQPQFTSQETHVISQQPQIISQQQPQFTSHQPQVISQQQPQFTSQQPQVISQQQPQFTSQQPQVTSHQPQFTSQHENITSQPQFTSQHEDINSRPQFISQHEDRDSRPQFTSQYEDVTSRPQFTSQHEDITSRPQFTSQHPQATTSHSPAITSITSSHHQTQYPTSNTQLPQQPIYPSQQPEPYVSGTHANYEDKRRY